MTPVSHPRTARSNFYFNFCKIVKTVWVKISILNKKYTWHDIFEKVGDGASYCWWCWSWCSMVFGGACDVNSKSPPPLTLHSGIFRPPPDIPPPLLILLCWTIRLPFIFNQWRQFWVKSRAINIKNFAIVLPFRIPRSSKVCSKCTKWPFRQSCDEVS